MSFFQCLAIQEINTHHNGDGIQLFHFSTYKSFEMFIVHLFSKYEQIFAQIHSQPCNSGG